MMKKLLALFLALLLSLSFAACGESESPDNNQAKSPEEGVFGEWYNTAGRKLEINEDGTYRIAHEAEGGTWKQQNETLLECTDAYGSFSATLTAAEDGNRVTFGPYGEFFRATEEDLRRFAKAQLYPIGNHWGFDGGLALVSENLKAVVINEDGLAVTVTGENIAMDPEFFGDLLILDERILKMPSGKVIVRGYVVGRNDEQLVVLKDDKIQNCVVYAVIDSHGTFVVDWTPLPRLGNESGGYAYHSALYANGAGGVLFYDDTSVRQENGEYLNIYYFLNPLTGNKFRIESLGGPGSFSSGAVFSSRKELQTCYAADWASPATPVEYEYFTVKEDGSLVEIAPVPACDMLQGDWCITFGNEQTGGKTIFRNAFTGENFFIDLPSEQMQISRTEHYWAISYMNEEKTERKLILFDYQGNALCDPIEQSYYTVGGMHYLNLQSYSDGTFLLGNEDDSGNYVYNAKGELMLSPEDLVVSKYCGDGLYLSGSKCVNSDGRIIIPGITYLPFK